jgi:hypothetical protein
MASSVKKQDPSTKSPMENKEKESVEMESMQRIRKKLSDEIIDFNRGSGASSSGKKLFVPLKKNNP